MTDVTELLNQVDNEELRTSLSSQFEALSGSALRKQLDEALDKVKTYESKDRTRAFKDAGFDPESGPGKALAKLYDGESDPEAIKQFAKDEFGFEPQSSGDEGAGTATGDAPADRRAAGEQRLNQLNGGAIPTRDPSIDDQIRQAEADGNWDAVDQLNAKKLAALRAA